MQMIIGAYDVNVTEVLREYVLRCRRMGKSFNYEVVPVQHGYAIRTVNNPMVTLVGCFVTPASAHRDMKRIYYQNWYSRRWF